MGSAWQFWIDRGGTFTDCLGRDPETGRVHIAKVLSSDRAPLVAIRQILRLPANAPIPPCDVRMGTTVATNALLERKGAPTGLVVTRGFGDLLEIGNQARPEIFALEVEKASMLYRAVLEVDARLDAGGRILLRPDRDALAEGLWSMRRAGIESLGVVVIHAYRDGTLEREIADLAKQIGFAHVSTSHEVAAEIGMVARGDTTLVDAYLTPLIGEYLRALGAELPGSSLAIMQSSGGLTRAASFRGKNAILSGPAGGVVAYARIAERAGLTRAIGFDMGGTSTDVSRWGGELDRTYEAEVAGVRLCAPMMAIHTVAAGGGSLCRFDGQRLTVGPESAGAAPGPLCYGHVDAWALTITDVNLMLGRVRTERFPFPLETQRVQETLRVMAGQLGGDRTPEQVAEGFFEIANASMAEAIRKVSVARGFDVREDALVVFGGAGGQHACALARRLGIRKILFHPFAGVLSAYGMGLATVTWDGEADAGGADLEVGALERLESVFAELETRGRSELEAQEFSTEATAFRRIDLRYRGTESALTLSLSDPNTLRREFEARHKREFGYLRSGHPVELVAIRVEVRGAAGVGPTALSMPRPYTKVQPRAFGRLYTAGTWREDVPLYWREELDPGAQLVGPALVLEATATIVIDPGFEATVDAEGQIWVLDIEGEGAKRRESTDLDPVRLEIFGNLYMSIAEQMGTVLRRTALSTNIRERLDFSCAIFDRDGGLVANAPHIPVHLGAMSESVRGVLRVHPTPNPGDVFVTNDPSAGGSHLPDITVITPVHDPGGTLLFFSASRGHHADVGGITPGSMPPFSRALAEEGVVFQAMKVVEGGRFDEALVLRTLCSGPHPAREPRQNIADLEAQMAANAHGARLLLEMVRDHGQDVVAAYMRHVQESAAEWVAEAIARLTPGERRFYDTLDDGTPIVVTLRVRGGRMEVDFTGSGPEHPGNLNAPRAVAVSAVIYVLRLLVGGKMPLNGGCLAPITLEVPERSILFPGPHRAVAAGNVETSQRVVDVLLGALGLAAASQGTMNNLTFGDDHFGYYETIAGGAGATQNKPGASGVHTHMTNTRITDPEVLEVRFPVRLHEFSIRRRSGGAGRNSGGDGLVREIEILRPLRISLLSERRSTQPFGLAGGDPGARGRNFHNGREVGSKVMIEGAAHDRIRIETPGGGGWGEIASDQST